ncbi:MAG: TonB-dependent receptor [Bacteroidota bacterium]
MKKLFATSIFSVFSIVLMQAQISGAINGTVLDADDEPVVAANVMLMSAADSNLVKLELSDDEGKFSFRTVAAGSYWLRSSYVGMPNVDSEIFTWDAEGTMTIPTLRMVPASNELEAVTVTAQRPLLEVKPDKMVFNVEGSVNAVGSDALELLRKAPGVVVDNNDNVMLLGKSGVRIYIDGKLSPLSSADLAAYLKTVQSSEIDAIEIITNPSSKYDAEGGAGIINIKMKKDKRHGTNANVNLGFSKGQLWQYNGGISANNRGKKTNLFGSYNYYDGENENYFNLFRTQAGLAFDQRNVSLNNWQSHNFRGGMDYFLNKHNTIGVLVTGSLADNGNTISSRTPISMQGQSAIDSILVANSVFTQERDNANFNINYRFDNGNNSWNIDADYGIFRNTSDNLQPNTYYDATESEVLNEQTFANNTPTNIDIYTFKVDHERTVGKGKLGTGVKLSYVETDNTFDFFNVLGGKEVKNDLLSNNFVYQENVNAGYINYQQQIKKFGFQAGLRVEQTNSEGTLTSAFQNSNVDTSYFNVFPSAGVTYQVNQKNSLQLNYSRRLNRPSYQDLNPFENRLDELTFEKGNPFLRPEYTNSFQLTHTYNYAINTSIGFSHTTDMITRLVDIDDNDEKSSFITWLNLDDQYAFNLSVSGALPIKQWWSSYTSMTGSYTRNKAEIAAGKVVDIEVPTFNIYSQHTFRLPKDISLEVSGWYNSPSIWGGTFETDAIWSIDAGIQKKILDGRGNIRVSVSDIFKSNVWSGTSRLGDLLMNTNGGWDSRRLRVNFSYLFGNSQVKSRRRQTGLEDESKRVKSN